MEQWDDIRFFLAIARERSLSGAARALRVDHATVGRRLTAFERRLSAKLFSRTPEGFAITSAGQAILNQAGRNGRPPRSRSIGSRPASTRDRVDWCD